MVGGDGCHFVGSVRAMTDAESFSCGRRSRSSIPTLPADALYEVLLRLPARDLCRLRAVCRPWRSLLSDPQFITDHAALHPEPLIVAGHLPGRSATGDLLDIMDLSGRVIRRVVKTEEDCAVKEWEMTAQLDGFCVLRGNLMNCLLLNPATGAVSALPHGFAEEHLLPALGIPYYNFKQLIAFGKVASTGEYKVLRVLHSNSHRKQPCEVFTVNGSSHGRWRGKKAPPDVVDFRQWSRVTINGVVYFLSRGVVMDQQDVAPLRLASFDLGTEEWRAILQGPLNLMGINVQFNSISVASLNGCLVVVHCTRYSSMDLWFLMDFEKGLWVKQHSIQLKFDCYHDKLAVHPVLVLNDGRIFTYIGVRGLMRIYDPNTCTYTDVAEIGPRSHIGLYTGNLLSLPNGAVLR